MNLKSKKRARRRRGRRKNFFIYIIGILITLIFIFAGLQKINELKKEKNLYNIKNPFMLKKEIKAKVYSLFDEIVLDNFQNIDITLEKYKIYGRHQIVEGTNNFDALDKANNINKNLKNKDSENDINKIVSNILNNEIYKNNFNHFSNSNKSDSFETYQKYYDSFIKNQKIITFDSGYILNRTDGYENLIGFDDFENINFNKINFDITNKNELIGLKYVNNKKYNILLKISKTISFNEKLFKNLNIKIESGEYRAYLEGIKEYKDFYILKYQLNDGIESALKNRFFNTNIKIELGMVYKIPKNSITKFNGYEGVYYIKNGRVDFTPITKISEDDQFSYVSVNMPNTIKNGHFKELTSFTKVIINNRNLKIGDFY